MIEKIILFNFAHIGDHLFSKSFIKQFCELNKNFDISLLLYYNSFLFSDIKNLNIITPSIYSNYNNNNINEIDSKSNINYNNNKFIYHSNNIINDK
jgi:hypothetical protein